MKMDINWYRISKSEYDNLKNLLPKELIKVEEIKRIISRSRFMGYLKVQESGARNMFGYDMLIQKDGVYEKCYKHFVEDKKEEDCEVLINAE